MIMMSSSFFCALFIIPNTPVWRLIYISGYTRKEREVDGVDQGLERAHLQKIKNQEDLHGTHDGHSDEQCFAVIK